MTITQCITFLVTSLVDLLSSEPVFPFVGVTIAGYVIHILFKMMGRGKA